MGLRVGVIASFQFFAQRNNSRAATTIQSKNIPGTNLAVLTEQDYRLMFMLLKTTLSKNIPGMNSAVPTE